MSAQPLPAHDALLQARGARFEPMTLADIDAVMAIEATAYAHPWTRGNFADSLRAGYAGLLLRAGDELLGYYVAMKGVDEVHLLNITVAPDHQGQGLGGCLLAALSAWSVAQGAQWLWLEVRASNERRAAPLPAPGLPPRGPAQGLLPRRPRPAGGRHRDEPAAVSALRAGQAPGWGAARVPATMQP